MMAICKVKKVLLGRKRDLYSHNVQKKVLSIMPISGDLAMRQYLGTLDQQNSIRLDIPQPPRPVDDKISQHLAYAKIL